MGGSASERLFNLTSFSALVLLKSILTYCGEQGDDSSEHSFERFKVEIDSLASLISDESLFSRLRSSYQNKKYISSIFDKRIFRNKIQICENNGQFAIARISTIMKESGGEVYLNIIQGRGKKCVIFQALQGNVAICQKNTFFKTFGIRHDIWL